jgi:hypothetical protein
MDQICVTGAGRQPVVLGRDTHRPLRHRDPWRTRREARGDLGMGLEIPPGGEDLSSDALGIGIDFGEPQHLTGQILL